MNTTQTNKETGFKCGYCSFPRLTENSKIAKFGDEEIRICQDCVKITEEYRNDIPVIGE